jgi:hypothetical protein
MSKLEFQDIEVASSLSIAEMDEKDVNSTEIQEKGI